jgi:hypothetical protein
MTRFASSVLALVTAPLFVSGCALDPNEETTPSEELGAQGLADTRTILGRTARRSIPDWAVRCGEIRHTPGAPVRFMALGRFTRDGRRATAAESRAFLGEAPVYTLQFAGAAADAAFRSAFPSDTGLCLWADFANAGPSMTVRVDNDDQLVEDTVRDRYALDRSWASKGTRAGLECFVLPHVESATFVRGGPEGLSGGDAVRLRGGERIAMGMVRGRLSFSTLLVTGGRSDVVTTTFLRANSEAFRVPYSGSPGWSSRNAQASEPTTQAFAGDGLMAVVVGPGQTPRSLRPAFASPVEGGKVRIGGGYLVIAFEDARQTDVFCQMSNFGDDTLQNGTVSRTGTVYKALPGTADPSVAPFPR